jgi:curli biogenesis system outer membrane secretion channel CsgG
MLLKQITIVSILGLALALQGAQDKSGSKPAAAASPVDTVVQLVKGGTSEALIIKILQKQNKPANLTPTDMLTLQKNGVSENIILVMMDPSATPVASMPAPVAASGPAVTPAQAEPAPAELRAACPVPADVAAGPNAQKRRLAVTAFDYSAVQNWVTFWFNNNTNIGQGIRAMLNVRMAQSKNIVLLEREKLNVITKEQDLGATNRVAQGGKAKIGKISGADAILLGDIVAFGRDDKSKNTNAAGILCHVPWAFGCRAAGQIGVNTKEEKAVVAINLRIVDAETAEVLESAEARGESSRKSKQWGAVTGVSGAGGAGQAMTSANFQDTIIGEATSNAVDKIVAFLNEKIPAIAAKSRGVEGRVANFDGCTLYLSVGGNDGVQVGDRFEIHRIVKDVVDPQTKEVLDQETVKVGEFVASTVRDKVAIGQYGGEPLSLTDLKDKGYAARLVTR